jgi:glycosyltransferase involved in cell wall biosynthesis
MRILLVVCFLNEEEHLPRMLRSMARQTRPPERLLLVDDGSTDGSHAVAETFAAGRPGVDVLRRPPRPVQRDRLAAAGELVAFQWAIERSGADWDVVGKIDADLEVPPDWLATLEAAFAADPSLGLAGSHLSTPQRRGTLRREPCASYHTHGATKLYRRACWQAISPLEPVLGWDMIDDVRARLAGWRVATVEGVRADVLQLRAVGAHDGRLRANARWGACAWGYGAHPLAVLLGGARRALLGRPPIAAGVAFVCGWLLAALRRAPRADQPVRRELRRLQRTRLTGRPRAAARLDRMRQGVAT